MEREIEKKNQGNKKIIIIWQIKNEFNTFKLSKGEGIRQGKMVSKLILKTGKYVFYYEKESIKGKRNDYIYKTKILSIIPLLIKKGTFWHYTK